MELFPPQRALLPSMRAYSNVCTVTWWAQNMSGSCKWGLGSSQSTWRCNLYRTWATHTKIALWVDSKTNSYVNSSKVVQKVMTYVISLRRLKTWITEIENNVQCTAIGSSPVFCVPNTHDPGWLIPWVSEEACISGLDIIIMMEVWGWLDICNCLTSHALWRYWKMATPCPKKKKNRGSEVCQQRESDATFRTTLNQVTLIFFDLGPLIHRYSCLQMLTY